MSSELRAALRSYVDAETAVAELDAKKKPLDERKKTAKSELQQLMEAEDRTQIDGFGKMVQLKTTDKKKTLGAEEVLKLVQTRLEMQKDFSETAVDDVMTDLKEAVDFARDVETKQTLSITKYKEKKGGN